MSAIAIASLERFRRRARRARAAPCCELCAEPIDRVRHRHVIDLDDRGIACACAACAVAFDASTTARYRTVPQRPRLPSFALGERDLAALGVPVGLAFFVRSSRLGRVRAVFPSPGGPTEAELPDGASLALDIADDVEALLVHRSRGGRVRSFIAPLDACYELTALLRREWRGIDGGDAVRRAVDAFLDSIERGAT